MRGLIFSWNRFLGITNAKIKIARTTGIPATRAGIERKLGSFIINTLLGKKPRF